MFAPQLSETEKVNHVLNHKSSPVYIEQQKELAKEVESDSIDIKTLTHYKMRHAFNKADRKKVRKIARDLGIKTRWLYQIFYIECGGNIYATNPYTQATGLIGFLPKTAEILGTSTDSLKLMNTSQQLDYVHKYFKVALNGKKMRRPADVYLAIFSPANLRSNDSTIIGRDSLHKTRVYKYNKVLDTNKDSVITISDINRFISLL
jgi:hypothetical protein